MIKITDIHKNSLAVKTPIKVGFQIEKIDEHPIDDILDLMFYSQAPQFMINYFDNDGKSGSCKIINKFDKPLGFEAELQPCQQCQNNCVFCFIDQMPHGLRNSLYVKDDDFLYSFFYGNFISLTNLTEKSLNKIIEQHISPLYISVHTTNPVLHKQLFRYKKDFDIMKTLKILNDNDIQLHTQIVIIPDVNDKRELTGTIIDLSQLSNVLSIGVVPVGITKHRNSLFPLRKVNDYDAEIIIRQLNIIENNIVNCADELFLTAKIPIPEEDYYNDFEQIENGIGMIRKSMLNWKKNKKKFIKQFEKTEGTPVFITSVSGVFAIEPIVKELTELINKNIRIVVIKNFFFGEEVTVTGLLTWQDIKSQLTLSENEYPAVSSAIFNYEMKTIDEFPVDNIEKEIGKKIMIIDELFGI